MMDKIKNQSKSIEDIQLGETVTVSYQITEADILAFAQLSGDFNPVHFDEDYAAKTIFKRRIAHGLISVSKFSGIFGTSLPGLGAIWESLDIHFAKPVYLNEPYSASVEVIEKSRRGVLFRVWVENAQGETVLEGQSSVLPVSNATRRRTADVKRQD